MVTIFNTATVEVKRAESKKVLFLVQHKKVDPFFRKLMLYNNICGQKSLSTSLLLSESQITKNNTQLVEKFITIEGTNFIQFMKPHPTPLPPFFRVGQVLNIIAYYTRLSGDFCCSKCSTQLENNKCIVTLHYFILYCLIRPVVYILWLISPIEVIATGTHLMASLLFIAVI